jgi:hypothetical protein
MVGPKLLEYALICCVLASSLNMDCECLDWSIERAWSLLEPGMELSRFLGIPPSLLLPSMLFGWTTFLARCLCGVLLFWAMG